MAAIPNVPTETKAPKKVKKTQIVFSEEMEEVRQDNYVLDDFVNTKRFRARKRIMKNQLVLSRLKYTGHFFTT